MRMVAVAIGTLFLAAAFGNAEAKVDCSEEGAAVQIIKFGPNSGVTPPGQLKKCASTPVSPPGAGANPGNNKPVGNAGEKGETNLGPGGDGDKGKSNSRDEWDPKAPKARP